MLEAEPSTLQPFLKTALARPLPDDLEGELWSREPLLSEDETPQDPDAKSDAESDGEALASKLPPWVKPTSGEFAAALRGMESRDEANDFDLRDGGRAEAKPENVAKACVWKGVEGAAEPEGLPEATDFDWDMVNAPRLSFTSE